VQVLAAQLTVQKAAGVIKKLTAPAAGQGLTAICYSSAATALARPAATAVPTSAATRFPQIF
jgi:hypothetical protein